MSDDTTKVERELTAEIVIAYARRNQLPTDQLPNLISTVHKTLHRLGSSEEEPKERVPAVPIKRSVARDQVICLECGWVGKMLRRHLGSHALTRDEYRARWRLSPDHPLTAPSYSEARSGLAKKLGLGRKPKTSQQRATGRGSKQVGKPRKGTAAGRTPKKSSTRKKQAA
jgi:predicted transcriptional regulator